MDGGDWSGRAVAGGIWGGWQMQQLAGGALESGGDNQPRFGVDISTGSAGGTVEIQISAVQFNG